eukprot:m.181553 g.181553  ORF g.181553 m.181553 type:complete len:761 (-) comp15302_c0_seq1:29-2311(-)
MPAEWVIGGLLAIGLVPLVVSLVVFKRTRPSPESKSGGLIFERQSVVNPAFEGSGSAQQQPAQNNIVVAVASDDAKSNNSDDDDSDDGDNNGHQGPITVVAGSAVVALAASQDNEARDVSGDHDEAAAAAKTQDNDVIVSDVSVPGTPERGSGGTPTTNDNAHANGTAANDPQDRTILIATDSTSKASTHDDPDEREPTREDNDGEYLTTHSLAPETPRSPPMITIPPPPPLQSTENAVDNANANDNEHDTATTEDAAGADSDGSWSDDDDDRRMKKVKAITIRDAPVATSPEEDEAALRRLSGGLLSLSSPGSSGSRARSRTLGDGDFSNGEDAFGAGVAGRARSNTEPPEPSSDVFGDSVRVEIPPDVPLPSNVPAIAIKLVKAQLREQRLHLWHSEFTDPNTGASRVSDALIAQIASATHLTDTDATPAIEYLRAFAFNLKLRQLRALPGAKPLFDANDDDALVADPWANTGSSSSMPPTSPDGAAVDSTDDVFATTPTPAEPFAAGTTDGGRGGSDPFASSSDPFASAPPSDNDIDEKQGSATLPPSAGSASDPFTTTTSSSKPGTDPFAAMPLSEGDGGADVARPDDSSATGTSSADPFANYSTTATQDNNSTTTTDPFAAPCTGNASSDQPVDKESDAAVDFFSALSDRPTSSSLLDGTDDPDRDDDNDGGSSAEGSDKGDGDDGERPTQSTASMDDVFGAPVAAAAAAVPVGDDVFGSSSVFGSPAESTSESGADPFGAPTPSSSGGFAAFGN